MKRIQWLILSFFSFVLLFFGTACRNEKIPLLSLGIQKNYVGTRLQPLYIDCGLDAGTYEWRLLKYSNGTVLDTIDRVVSNSKTLITILDKTGDYTYQLSYEREGERLTKQFSVHIDRELINYSPYISDVIDYVPAPGRFVNDYLGLVAPPKSYDDVLARCKTIVCGGKINKSISLGGFGGYIVFSFDHAVMNVPNSPDFAIYTKVTTVEGGGESSENPEGRIYTNGNPGVVWVAFDSNNNGKPDDDEWYELCRPTDGKSVAEMERSPMYSITYTKNNSGRYERADSLRARDFAIPDHIRWEANYAGKLPLVKQQLTGYIPKLVFDGFDPYAKDGLGETTTKREYWPLWRQESSTITLTGTLFPDNGEELWSGEGAQLREKTRYWALPNAMADNLLPKMTFDIGDAIDSEGNPVALPGVQFVKVQTGVNLQLGRMGGSSTEMQGAIDLHMKVAE